MPSRPSAISASSTGVGMPLAVSEALSTPAERGPTRRSPKASSVAARRRSAAARSAAVLGSPLPPDVPAAAPPEPPSLAAAAPGRAGLHAADGCGDDGPAVAVLVEVGRDLAERGAPVGVRVLAVERAVGGAVADHRGRVRRRRGRQRQDRESGREHDEMSHSSGHAENALLVRIDPVHERNALNQLPQASNWIRHIRAGSFICPLRPQKGPSRRRRPMRRA